MRVLLLSSSSYENFEFALFPKYPLKLYFYLTKNGEKKVEIRESKKKLEYSISPSLLSRTLFLYTFIV